MLSTTSELPPDWSPEVGQSRGQAERLVAFWKSSRGGASFTHRAARVGVSSCESGEIWNRTESGPSVTALDTMKTAGGKILRAPDSESRTLIFPQSRTSLRNSLAKKQPNANSGAYDLEFTFHRAVRLWASCPFVLHCLGCNTG